MNCTNCGADVTGKNFCPQCGAPVAQTPAYQAPANAIPVQSNQTLGSPTKVLVFGIIGLALCWTGVLGLIFSIVGLVQANKYIATYGDVANQVRIGKRLAIAGLIVSIVFIVIWAIYIIAAIAFAVSHQNELRELNSYLQNYNYYFN